MGALLARGRICPLGHVSILKPEGCCFPSTGPAVYGVRLGCMLSVAPELVPPLAHPCRRRTRPCMLSVAPLSWYCRLPLTHLRRRRTRPCMRCSAKSRRCGCQASARKIRGRAQAGKQQSLPLLHLKIYDIKMIRTLLLQLPVYR